MKTALFLSFAWIPLAACTGSRAPSGASAPSAPPTSSSSSDGAMEPGGAEAAESGIAESGTPGAESAAPAAGSEPTPEANGGPPTPSAAPMAPADLARFVDGNAIGFKSATGEIAAFVTVELDEQFHAVRIYDAGGDKDRTRDAATFDFNANLSGAELVKSGAAKLVAALAGFELIEGQAFGKGTNPKASLPGVPGEVRYHAKSTTIELSVKGKKKVKRKLGDGGVTSIVPRAAFALPTGDEVAVLVRFQGDVAVLDELERFKH